MKVLWGTLGIIFLIAGFIGIPLPILPTTPFILLAAFCFSKSSERLHTWLLSSKLFGKIISDWEKNGIIRLRVKVIATIMMLLLFTYTLVLVPVVIWIKAFVSLSGVLVLTFIWTRPSD